MSRAEREERQARKATIYDALDDEEWRTSAQVGEATGLGTQLAATILQGMANQRVVEKRREGRREANVALWRRRTRGAW